MPTLLYIGVALASLPLSVTHLPRPRKRETRWLRIHEQHYHAMLRRRLVHLQPL